MLFDRSDIVPTHSQRVPQSIETPVTFVSAPGVYARYVYSRSSDSMASGIEGQDYLCFQHNDQKFVFVVCDGVGSSFCGNLAARILGDGLLEWLWAADITTLGGPAALGEAAASALNRLQKQARYEVEDYQIPGQISPLVKQALEAQRAYGSEAVFAAMRIDHSSPMIPDGLISVCWMGDTQAHVFDEDGQEIEIGGRWDNANRWSTTQGVRGQMGVWMREMPGVGRITAFTDGLTAHAKKLSDYSDDTLDREIRAGARLPTSDDVALIDVVIRSTQYEGYPDPDLPDPNLERPLLDPIWNPTGADRFELRWNWPGEKNASFMIQEATNPALTHSKVMNVIAKETLWQPEQALKPGHYYYRVRAANRRGVISPWSELRQTRVAYPPPPAPSLEVDRGGDMPALEWEAEGESLDYVLQEAAAGDFEDAKVVYSGRGASWSASPGYKPGTYYYRVQAVSDGGAGPWSPAARVRVILPPPPRPQLAVMSDPTGGEGSSYRLRWQPAPGAAYYEVEETRAEAGGARLIRVEDMTYTVSDQPPGDYVYRLRACHEHGCSEWSSEQSVTMSERPPAEAPVLAATQPDVDGVIRISWAALPDAAEYEIELAEEEKFESARLFTVREPAFSTTRREPGEMFARVQGINSGGGGPWSKPIRVSVGPAALASNPSQTGLSLGAPVLAAPEIGDSGETNLHWSEVGDAARYVLEISRNPHFSSPMRLEGLEVSVVFHPPASGQYWFRVRATRGDESGAPSNIVTIDVERPTAPSLWPLDPVKANTPFEIAWTAVPGGVYYDLEGATSDAFEPDKTSTVRVNHPSLKFVISGRAAGRYFYRVRAVDVYEQASLWSRLLVVQVTGD